MSKFEFSLHDQENSEDAKEILVGLMAHNLPFTGTRDYRDITMTIRDSETKKLIGGLAGSTQWKWLFVKWLWVSDVARGQRFGQKLLNGAEAEAVSRGCIGVWLDTFTFQAPGFYEKQGYARFGEIRDFPPGMSRFFYSKRLTL